MLAEARKSPPWWKATPQHVCRCSEKVAVHAFVVRLQSLTTPSPEHVASRSPCGWKSTPLSHVRWPSPFMSSSALCALCTAHTRHRQSSDVEAKMGRVGWKESALTLAPCALTVPVRR